MYEKMLKKMKKNEKRKIKKKLKFDVKHPAQRRGDFRTSQTLCDELPPVKHQILFLI